jgi:XapX domain-containing protein
MKIAVAFLIGLSIGALSRWFDIPVPAPPKLIGALLVLSVTAGYLGTDFLIDRRETAAVQQDAHAPPRE